jgi:hypothetical protein
VLEHLVPELDAEIARLGGGRPTLVLLGDLLELALTRDDIAYEAFSRFLELAYPAAGGGRFDPEILYVPGNHDHHLWETAREGQYAAYLAGLPPGEVPGAPWHVTRLVTQRDPDPVHSTVLQAVVDRARPGLGLRVRVVYPNLAIEHPGDRRLLLFHHGHFTEGIYTLMSSGRSLAFPGRQPPVEIWELEADNFAWIDFFWSSLGRSGGVGDDVGLVYEMLQDPTAVEALALGVYERAPLRGRSGWLRRGPLGWSTRRATRAAVGRLAAPERFRASAVLSEGTRARLAAYLGGPLLGQVRRERAPDKPGPTGIPDEVTFVFGHTHKPFSGSIEVPGYPGPVQLVNDGGWVVDAVEAKPLAGASVVLVTDDLDVRTWDVFGPGTGERATGTPPSPELADALRRGAELRVRALTAQIAAGKRAAGPGAAAWRPPTAPP